MICDEAKRKNCQFDSTIMTLTPKFRTKNMRAQDPDISPDLSGVGKSKENRPEARKWQETALGQ